MKKTLRIKSSKKKIKVDFNTGELRLIKGKKISDPLSIQELNLTPYHEFIKIHNIRDQFLNKEGDIFQIDFKQNRVISEDDLYQEMYQEYLETELEKIVQTKDIFELFEENEDIVIVNFNFYNFSRIYIPKNEDDDLILEINNNKLSLSHSFESIQLGILLREIVEEMIKIILEESTNIKSITIISDNVLFSDLLKTKQIAEYLKSRDVSNKKIFILNHEKLEEKIDVLDSEIDYYAITTLLQKFPLKLKKIIDQYSEKLITSREYQSLLDKFSFEIKVDFIADYLLNKN